MAGTSIDYESLVRTAMRGVVRDALSLAAASGLPGEHHFYIGFRTGAAGVRLDPDLRARYPGEMTVVLQHRFWDLEVDGEGFSVTLSFGGIRRRLAVPFAALTSFADPEAEFALRFEPEGEAAAEAPASAESAASEPERGAKSGDPGDPGDNVVALAFPRRGKDGGKGG